MGASMENLKGLIDVNSIVGAPITTPDGTTIIPVSKVSFGFASGGSDFPRKSTKDLFGGGSGAGVSILPVAFLVAAKDGSVRLIQLSDTSNNIDRALGLMPEMVDKVAGFFHKDEKTQPEKETECKM